MRDISDRRNYIDGTGDFDESFVDSVKCYRRFGEIFARYAEFFQDSKTGCCYLGAGVRDGFDFVQESTVLVAELDEDSW